MHHDTMYDGLSGEIRDAPEAAERPAPAMAMMCFDFDRHA